jgi:hypothetical protein
MLVRVLSVLYSTLLMVDGVLSILDSISPAPEHHLSTWTTISLLLLSIPAFIVGIVLKLGFKLRRTWPLLVSSGAYSAGLVVMFTIVAAIAMTRGPDALASAGPSGSAWGILNPLFGGFQVVIGSACCVGAVHANTPGESFTRAA